MTDISKLNQTIEHCNRCKRLRRYCQKIAKQKRKAYLDQTYYGKPVPGFGDLKPKFWILGLAPGAHGANRTGRVFTGDRSGEWLYRALFKQGFATQAESQSLQDGLKLRDTYISCVVRCAPPDNKPSKVEIHQCSPYLKTELDLFWPRLKVILALGQVALQAFWPHLITQYPKHSLKRPPFGHGVKTLLPDGKMLLLSYHPSQQNTFTGKLTEPLFDQVFKTAREFI